jgi:glycosyltransferase involved in cell wall biosynthesis
LPLFGRYNFKILTDQLQEFKPSVLHCLSDADANLARGISKQLLLPYLLTVNSLQKRFPPLSLSRKRLAAIIVPSERIAESISALYPFFSDRIRLINMGTFVSDSTVCFNQTGRLASIITLCPPVEKTDFSKLLDAIKRLAVEGYDFVVAVISDKQADWNLRKTIFSLGLSPNIVIVPRLEPLREVLTAADIFIQSCPSSSFNTVILEAMSVGVAVAGCRGGADDLVIEGKTAFVFNPDDQISIFSCLKEMLDSRDKTRKIARQAQQYLRANHSVSAMVDQTLQCYRQALQWYNVV